VKNAKIKGEFVMKKYVCSVCGYVHEGDTPPEKCPVCKVPAEKFKEMAADAKLAAEHEYGVYAKTVKIFIILCNYANYTKNIQREIEYLLYKGVKKV
jgi:rubredoxin